MDEKQLRQLARRDIGAYGWALLIYFFLLNACVVVSIIVGAMVAVLREPSIANLPTVPGLSEADIMGNGWGYIVTCLLAVLLIRVWKGKTFWAGLWQSGKDMTFGGFWRLACLFIAGQMVFQVAGTVQETILNQFGMSVLESMELATVNNDTISMFLYTVLVAPVVEELIFRGLVLRGLEKYGKIFAILISAILFGLFHGNIVQGPYAFAVGLVLGYTAVEYNIGWAMVLHMINNLILGDTLPRLTQGLGETGSGLVIQGLILACTAVAVVCLIRHWKEIGAYIRANAPQWSAWWGFCTAPGIIAIVIVMEGNAFAMLR